MTKRNMTKRLVAIAATMMMLVAMILPATAAPGNPEGTITVHKLAGNTPSFIPNLTGEKLATLPTGYTLLDGAEFTLWTVDPAGIAAVNTAIAAGESVLSHQIDVSGPTPVVRFNMTGTPATISANVLATAYGKHTTGSGSFNTGEAVFGPNVPDGYYILEETVTPTGYAKVEASLIRLPLTNADGTVNYDVHVYPKNVSNRNLTTKDIGPGAVPVSTGSIMPFELKARFRNAAAAPNTVNSVQDLRAGTGPYTYGTARIREELNDYFATVPASLNVYWLAADGSLDTAAGALATSLYTTNPSPLTTVPGQDFAVTLTNAGIDAAITGNKVGFGVAFNATYVGSPTAGAGTPAVLTNKMYSFMDPATGNGDGGEDDDTVNIPSISVTVNKFKEDGTTPLADVTFAITTSPAPGIHYDPAETYTEAALTGAGYVLDKATSTPADGKPLLATTTSTGIVSFSNLDGYADTSGITYYLKEIQTHPGYQLKVNTIAVQFLTKTAYNIPANVAWFTTGGNWSANAQIVESADITNYPLGEYDPDEPGFSLPLTGGAGTMAFTAVGIIVMLGAAVVYLRGKKKEI